MFSGLFTLLCENGFDHFFFVFEVMKSRMYYAGDYINIQTRRTFFRPNCSKAASMWLYVLYGELKFHFQYHCYEIVQ